MAQLLTFSFLLLALSSTPSFAQDAKPAEPATANDNKSRYPNNRNYMKERIEFIRRVQNQPIDPMKGENSWSEFASTVIGVRGVMDFASVGPAISKWIEQDEQGSGRSFQDLLDAVAGILPDAPAELIEEGERVLDQLNRSPLAESMDSLVNAEAFVPVGHSVSPAMTLLLPYLSPARAAARLNAARMSYAARKGDEKELLRAYKHQLALARACSYEGCLISTLVSDAIEALSHSRLIEIQRDHSLSEATLRSLLESIAKSPRADWSVGINGERLMGLDTINWVYNTGEFEVFAAMSTESKGVSKAIWRAKAMLYASREDAMAKFDSYFCEICKAMDPDKAIGDAAMERARSIEKDVARSTRYTVPAMLIPEISQALTLEQRVQTQRSGTRIMLAAELHKAIHGSLPASIDELKPLLGNEPLVDWYDPARLPPRYKLVNDAPGYVVYSVGRDGADNGGVCNPKNQYGEPNQGDACDYVLNWVEPKSR